MISDIASECFMPLTYGGRIRNIEDMKQIFRLGVEKIAICTHAIENPDFIKKTSELFGKQSVVIAIDVKKDFFGNYTISTFSGKTKTEYEPCDFAILAERMGAGEILVNSIDRDGTMRGYDINLIKSVSDKVNIPVIACGGAGGLEAGYHT